MVKYRKLIVAVIGAVIAIATKHYGPEAEIVVDLELLATAFGVWAAPNQ